MRNLLYLIFVIALVGCASITQGTSQILSFKLEPKEAKCVLTRIDDGELGSISASSNTIHVGKDKDDIIVQCSAPGYQQKTTRIVSAATTAGVTGVLLDFGITDMITGAMYAYPTNISIVMEKEPIATSKNQADQQSNAQSAPQLTGPPNETPQDHSSAFKKLKELDALRKDGVLTQEEFDLKKAEILKGM